MKSEYVISRYKREAMYAFSLGYRVTESGFVVSPNNSGIKTHIRTKKSINKNDDLHFYKSSVFILNNCPTEEFGKSNYEIKVKHLAAIQLFGDAFYLNDMRVLYRDRNTTNNRLDNFTIEPSNRGDN